MKPVRVWSVRDFYLSGRARLATTPTPTVGPVQLSHQHNERLPAPRSARRVAMAGIYVARRKDLLLQHGHQGDVVGQALRTEERG